ncbi:hypothetical protein [Accumulibacter sp.]|jgi:hypothetical protein|uniref:hypothetical protein n=1 Tax=Accumulibacter sp. TaxID=2053492 RepID=UPI001AD5A72A|nr:hypothetical protein [Accumulibacter sp.]MBN8454492.1 hypothetical protein [Accumulibacter sp.]
MKIKVDLDQVVEIYRLLESLNDFFHEPANYEDTAKLLEFMGKGNYEKIRHGYYAIASNWLPKKVQKKLWS